MCVCVWGGGGGGGGKFNSMGLDHSGSQLTKSENHLHTCTEHILQFSGSRVLLINE